MAAEHMIELYVLIFSFANMLKYLVIEPNTFKQQHGYPPDIKHE